MADYLWAPIIPNMTRNTLIQNGAVFSTEEGIWNIIVGTTTGLVKVGAYKYNHAGYIVFASNNPYNVATAYFTYSGVSTISSSPIDTVYSTGMWYSKINAYSDESLPQTREFLSAEAVLSAMNDGIWTGAEYPITYYPTNVNLNGPAQAAVGDTVNVNCTFPTGYTMKNPSPGGDIRVTNNGVDVPYVWDSTNKSISFTMPDPL